MNRALKITVTIPPETKMTMRRMEHALANCGQAAMREMEAVCKHRVIPQAQADLRGLKRGRPDTGAMSRSLRVLSSSSSGTKAEVAIGSTHARDPGIRQPFLKDYTFGYPRAIHETGIKRHFVMVYGPRGQIWRRELHNWLLRHGGNRILAKGAGRRQTARMGAPLVPLVSSAGKLLGWGMYVWGGSQQPFLWNALLKHVNDLRAALILITRRIFRGK